MRPPNRIDANRQVRFGLFSSCLGGGGGKRHNGNRGIPGRVLRSGRVRLGDSLIDRALEFFGSFSQSRDKNSYG